MYFGSSLPLERGLQFEHAEFLVRDQSKEAQARMREYIATTNATGELPLLNRETYERALELAAELSAAPGAGGKPIQEWLEVRPFLNERATVTE